MTVKLNRMELVNKIREIIGAHSNDPAEEMIALGTAILQIGQALKGQSPADAKAILAAVQALEGA
jgi:hypothetical protein